jgi:hypothetical protein
MTLKKQRGLSMIGMIVICVVIIAVALLGIKVFPDYMEYRAVLGSVKAVAMEPATRSASVAQIRASYDKRSSIDNVTAVKGVDLDITKEGNDVILSFSYSKRIPLYGPVSLMIDFEGSSAQ